MASAGGSCPLCRKYASFTLKGKLYRHRGNVSKLIGSGYLECRASGHSLETAALMRVNREAGRYPHRNEDGSWIGHA